MPHHPAAAAAPPLRRPSSARRIAASRANGKLSRGPKTPEGQRHSCGNRRKHGLSATHSFLIPGESESDFLELRADLLAEHRPTNFRDQTLVEIMASSTWLLNRVRTLQKKALDEEIALQDPALPPAMRATIAFRNLTSSNVGGKAGPLDLSSL